MFKMYFKIYKMYFKQMYGLEKAKSIRIFRK